MEWWRWVGRLKFSYPEVTPNGINSINERKNRSIAAQALTSIQVNEVAHPGCTEWIRGKSIPRETDTFSFAGTGWVAWMRDTFVDDYVELVFEFEVIWIFEAVHIYTNNYFSRDVQVGNLLMHPFLLRIHINHPNER